MIVLKVSRPRCLNNGRERPWMILVNRPDVSLGMNSNNTRTREKSDDLS